MKLDHVKNIIDLMNAHGLSEFEIEENGVRIALKKSVPDTPAPVVQTGPASVTPAAQAAGAALPAPEADPGMEEIKAPFVGTFYRAPAPDAEPYVTVGQEVGPDTVLCILEAMKVMNEIKAETKGIVREILVENAHAVQFGQPLFKIEKT